MPDYHIVVDLEMNPVSTLSCHDCGMLKAETIEIGAIKIDAESNNIVDEFSCVVRPEFNQRIEPRITRMTGITTSEALAGVSFCTALSTFVNWIGPDHVKIYSWSTTDYFQLQKECFAKHIAFPDNLCDWIDFQAEYPQYIGYSRGKCFSLKDAASLIGTTINPSRAHRALYDAQITAELVLFALTEEYKNYNHQLANVLVNTHNPLTYSIGEACREKLAELMAQMKGFEEKEESHHGRKLIGTTAAFVR